MKTISIFFISSAPYYKRLIDIIDNNASDLLDYNFTIIASEIGHFYNYSFDDLTLHRWWKMIPVIYSGLRDNLKLLSDSSSSLLPPCFSGFIDYESVPQWLQPRELSFGDLSVISKHHQAIKSFLYSKDDFALICEDDVIFEPSSLRSLHKLAQGPPFDFIDIAGGDNLHTQNVDIVIDNTFELERKYNFATRTACCYLISRNYAEKLSRVLESPVFPIDWSLSFSFSLFSTPPLVYWLCQPLAEHGSSTGKVSSWRLSI